jgi:hypothetical protein
VARRERTPAAGPVRYVERLRVPWWLWVLAPALAGLAAAEVYLGAAGPLTWIPYAVLLPATVAGLLALGRLRVAVDGEELWVDDAHLPVRYIADVVSLDGTGRRRLLGPLAAPYAFVVQRPWIRGTVQVVLDDPADPTPYWVVSTRHPGALAAAIRAAKADGTAPGDATVPGRAPASGATAPGHTDAPGAGPGA